MSREKLRRTSAGFRFHVFPELHAGSRIESSTGHVLKANDIGFGFLGAPVGQENSQVRAQCHHLTDVATYRSRAKVNDIAGNQLLVRAFEAVLLGNMSNFVADHGGQFILSCCNSENPVEYTYLAAGHCEGVYHFVVKNFDFPVHAVIRIAQLGNNRPRHAVGIGFFRRARRQGHLCLHLLKLFFRDRFDLGLADAAGREQRRQYSWNNSTWVRIHRESTSPRTPNIL